MNLFELTLRLKGFPIAEAKKRLAKIQEISKDDYPDYVSRLQADIVAYHQRENSWYREFAGSQPFTDWNSIPILSKKDLQQPLAGRLSRGFTAKNVYVNKTSGSSGHPFIFAKDRFSHALTWAIIMDRYKGHGIVYSHSLEARFYGIPLDRKGYRKERLKDWLSRRYRFPIFDLSDAKLEGFLETFRRKKFDYINGYTSSLVLFAKFLQKKGILLKDVCPSLCHCIVTSEMLFDEDKVLLQRVFGVPVINEYGASELDLIAFTGIDNTFLVNSASLFVEIVDPNNRPVPHGTAGRIIITSLYNRAHPMIRYDIGDTGVLAPESTLKTPVLQQLIGRTNDVAVLPGGKTIPGLTFYYVTKSVIEDHGNVKEFVVEQTKPSTFRIIYVSERPLSDKEIDTIKNALYEYVAPQLTLEFERVSVLDRSSRGKLKQFNTLLK
ncbi:phenylacetate--CoA ligase family protein [Altibacter sp.]|uniref:phenylacetate--CoA ligase family protein n=1 Tax=Altibacter sp. TaxID=2024823 RepID=UPI000C8AC78E|nr:phenylacetate--CoA ligase family protein [Altibacter sp.]MAP54395.1 AMP-binding protein [Altibacter sp.]